MTLNKNGNTNPQNIFILLCLLAALLQHRQFKPLCEVQLYGSSHIFVQPIESVCWDSSKAHVIYDLYKFIKRISHPPPPLPPASQRSSYNHFDLHLFI